jgi:cytochrome c oxidase cbb3-type subunit 3
MTGERALVCVAAIAALAGCQRERHDIRPSVAASARSPGVVLSPLGPAAPPPPPAIAATLAEAQTNGFAMNEGKRLYAAYNCVGCHAHGGGAIGPALMDATWIYGSEPANVFATIVEGRPNGMPAFGTRIDDYQIWQLVSYVLSLSGRVRQDVAPGRAELMSLGKPPVMQSERPPTAERGGARR